MNNKVKQNMLWNSIGSLVYLGGQWLLSVIVVRILGYGEAGILSLSMSLTNTFYSLANYGIRNFQVSDLKGQFSDREYIYNRCITSVMAFVLCFGYCAVQGYDEHTCIAVLWFMSFRVVEAFQDVLYGIEQRMSDMKSIGISNMVKGILAAVTFIMVVAFSRSLNAALFAMFLAMLAVFVLYDCKCAAMYIEDDRAGNCKNAFKMMVVCAPVALNNFMTNYILTYPKLAIEQEMGEEALGIYSSIGMPVLIVQMAASYIFAPLIVVFADHLQKRETVQFWKLLLKVVFMIGALGIAALVFAKIAGKFFLGLLFGETICEYVYILYPLILGTILTALIWFFNAILTVCRDYIGLCISSLACIVVIVLISKGMIELYSFNGASYALCCALAVKMIVMLGTLIRKFKRMK